MDSKLKDAEIKSLKSGQQKKESLGRGNGSLIFRRVNKTISAYYGYWIGKQSVFVKLDDYKQSAKSTGKTLSKLRDQALDMVALRKQLAPLDLKEYLQEQDADRLKQQEAKRLKQQKESTKGSLQDLMKSYANTLKARHKERGTEQTFDVMSNFRTFVIKPFPDLAKKHAGDVQSSDLSQVFEPIMKRDKPGMYNQLRRYLSACFNYGIKADYNPRETHKHGKKFNIKFNPVMPFPEEPSTPRARELSHEEIRALWRDIDLGIFADNEQYGLFIKFCFACFGNRPTQLSRLKWSDINLEDRTFTLIDYKGKGKPRISIIPLTDRAMDIIQSLPSTLDYPCLTDNYMDIIGTDKPLFTTKLGTVLSYAVLERKIKEHNNAIMMFKERKAEYEGVVYQHKERWTMKDFRRTATSIMTRSRIIKEHRYLLQSRTDGSIESRHYDVSDRLDEKREAAEKYDAMLVSILEDKGELPKKPVIDSYAGFRDMVVESGKLHIIKDYVREGYRKKEVQQWVRQMLADGIVEMYGRMYVLKGFGDQNEKKLIEKHLKRKDYKDFKKVLIEAGVLKSQEAYIIDGYSNLKVKRWFRLLKVEGVIERAGRAHIFSQTEPA